VKAPRIRRTGTSAPSQQQTPLAGSELRPEEKETVILYDMRERKFTVTTIVPKHIRRFTKILGPGAVLDPFGTMRWVTNRIPVLR